MTGVMINVDECAFTVEEREQTLTFIEERVFLRAFVSKTTVGFMDECSNLVNNLWSVLTASRPTGKGTTSGQNFQNKRLTLSCICETTTVFKQ